MSPFDEVLLDEGLPVLEADDRVVGIARGDFRFPFTENGEPLDGDAMRTVDGELSPVILEGRRPEAPDEIALGTKTMRAHDAAIGDAIDVGLRATRRDPVPMKIVGRAVFPVFAEAGSLGEGAFTTLRATEYIRDEPLESYEQGLLVRVDSRDHVDDVVGAVRKALPFEGELFVIQQGKPTDIVNFGRVEGMPFVLGGVLAAIAAATLAHLLLSATRRRRGELAVLKTLGFVRWQVAGAVSAQATTVVVVGLIVGVPLGIAAGRIVWTALAENLGVVASPAVPLLAIAIIVVAALVLANAIALVPARIASRTPAATVLRAE